MKKGNEPVRAEKCETCPFRGGSKYAHLRSDLAESAKTVSRICHSTGSNNAINRRTGKPSAICRGARDVQLAFMVRLGVLKEATDAAWNAERVKRGMPAQEIIA